MMKMMFSTRKGKSSNEMHQQMKDKDVFHKNHERQERFVLITLT